MQSKPKAAKGKMQRGFMDAAQNQKVRAWACRARITPVTAGAGEMPWGMVRAAAAALLPVMAVAMALATPLAAQEADAEKGQALFASYCAQCHGADAKGGGPMAEMLAIETPDLTVLSRGNDGVFPTFEVATKIDGRAQVLAHGGDMPLFGPFLDSDQFVALSLPNGQPMMTGLPLANVLVYLESIQAE